MPLKDGGGGIYTGAETIGGTGPGNYENPFGSRGSHYDFGPPEVQWVVFMPQVGAGFKCLLGEGTPNVTEGYGGWTTTDRPRDLPIVEWAGQPAYRITVPLLFNGLAQNRSIEGLIRRLEAMARPNKRSGGEPPTVKVYLPGFKPRSWRMNWVIESIEWGDAERKPSGQRVRQWVTVNLLQRGDDDLISPARRRNQDRAHLHTGGTGADISANDPLGRQ